MVWHNDEPLDFANSVHIFALSELAKRHVTVVLTGEGSDELFAGYPRYRIPDLARSYQARARGHAPRCSARVVARSPAARSSIGTPRPRRPRTLLYNSSYLRPERRPRRRTRG